MSYAYRIVGAKESEQSLFFMLNALLQARIDVGDETTDDEDVNVYLASLLHALVDRAHTRRDQISKYDTDVARFAESGDLRSRFEIYRANADHTLVTVALFDRPWVRSRGVWPRQDVEDRRLETRGRLYYTMAASLEQKLRYGSTAVSDVLSKLSERFDLYARVLVRVRSSHLHLFARISDGEAFHLERHAQEGAKPALIRHGRDQFLDAYGDWMSTTSTKARGRVNRLGEALTKLDPEFAFDRV
jgi:hypothetical protein